MSLAALGLIGGAVDVATAGVVTLAVADTVGRMACRTCGQKMRKEHVVSHYRREHPKELIAHNARRRRQSHLKHYRMG